MNGSALPVSLFESGQKVKDMLLPFPGLILGDREDKPLAAPAKRLV